MHTETHRTAIEPSTTVRLPAPSVYTPYFNEWNADVYQRQAPFDEAPLEVYCSSTSGACVAVTPTHWVGLRRPAEARFAWDGHTFTAQAEEADLLVGELQPDGDWWTDYHAALNLPPAPVAPFGHRPEYCTWVEQGWQAARQGSTPSEALSMELTRGFLKRIAQQDWPLGRVTVDEGWCPRHGSGGFGDWLPKPGFDMARLAAEIAEQGHVPGLWLAPALISPTSDVARACPELLGEPFSMTAESGWNGFAFLRPGDAARDFLAALFRQGWDWGFRKFKLDIFYGPKRLMLELHRLCAEAARELPGPVELEGHVPDPFVARHVHVVRLNDVLIDDAHPQWQRVAEAHFRVCRQSCPDHLLNLDHLGGNRPTVSEAQWLEHAALLAGQLPWGYPVVSLLPEHVGERAGAATQELLTPSHALS